MTLETWATDDPEYRQFRAADEDRTRAALDNADSLDAAWAEAEAALPEGWRLDGLNPGIVSDRGVRTPGWVARAWGSGETIWVRATTPAAALRALAAKLQETAG